MEKLGEVLNELDLMSLAGCEEWLQTLQAYLEVCGVPRVCRARRLGHFQFHTFLFDRFFCRLLERVSFCGIIFGGYAADS